MDVKKKMYLISTARKERFGPGTLLVFRGANPGPPLPRKSTVKGQANANAVGIAAKRQAWHDKTRIRKNIQKYFFSLAFF